MSYGVLYHPEVLASDIPRINVNIQRILARAVERRLKVAPESYGKPLSGNLAGYWKLRVGDFRIVFKVVRDEIWIYGISGRFF